MQGIDSAQATSVAGAFWTSPSRLAQSAALAVLTTLFAAGAVAPASAHAASRGNILPCLQDAGQARPDPCEPKPECSDSFDNDVDGRIDYGDDPGCDSPWDESESPDPPQCSDAIDNDGDGRIDYPADRGCESPSDDDETDPPSRVVDFDGDGLADRAVFRPSETGATFHVLKSKTGTDITVTYGLKGDIPAVGDYDGDGLINYAVWRPSSGVWYILLGDSKRTRFVALGTQGDIPVPGDYDGDGKTDVAIWRPSNGTWYVQRSSDGQIVTQAYGLKGDKPVPGDYDGDNKNDFAVWRPSNATWYVIKSSSGDRREELQYAFGLPKDKPVPGDYNGDKLTDIAVWRPSEGKWYVSTDYVGGFTTQNWGTAGDIPVPAYYDNVAKTDYAVWRPSTGYWYVLRSASNNTADYQLFGHGRFGDIPIFFSGHTGGVVDIPPPA